jgi:hypothetical protein
LFITMPLLPAPSGYLLEAGTDLVAVFKLLGHSTIQTMMRYAHHAKTALHEAVNRVSVTQFGTTTTTTTKAETQGGNGRAGGAQPVYLLVPEAGIEPAHPVKDTGF